MLIKTLGKERLNPPKGQHAMLIDTEMNDIPAITDLQINEMEDFCKAKGMVKGKCNLAYVGLASNHARRNEEVNVPASSITQSTVGDMPVVCVTQMTTCKSGSFDSKGRFNHVPPTVIVDPHSIHNIMWLQKYSTMCNASKLFMKLFMKITMPNSPLSALGTTSPLNMDKSYSSSTIPKWNAEIMKQTNLSLEKHRQTERANHAFPPGNPAIASPRTPTATEQTRGAATR